jgi:SlyX protein
LAAQKFFGLFLDMDATQQIARLEERLAWLERHLTEQDKAMLEMAEDLTRLRRELLVLRERLPSGGGDEPGMSAHERPPHY